MAAADLNLSRRALLGAACAVPVLGAVEGAELRAASLLRHPALDPGPTFSLTSAAKGRGMPDRACPEPCRRARHGDKRTSRWDRALAAFTRAEVALASAAGTPDEALYDRLVGRFNRALRSLLRAPAPDLAALSRKIDLAVDHDVATLAGGEACMAVLKRDARCLALSACPEPPVEGSV